MISIVYILYRHALGQGKTVSEEQGHQYHAGTNADDAHKVSNGRW